MKGYRVSIKPNDLLDLTSEKSYAGKTSKGEKVTDAKSTITIDRGFTCTAEEEFQLLLDTHMRERREWRTHAFHFRQECLTSISSGQLLTQSEWKHTTELMSIVARDGMREEIDRQETSSFLLSLSARKRTRDRQAARCSSGVTGVFASIYLRRNVSKWR